MRLTWIAACTIFFAIFALGAVFLNNVHNNGTSPLPIGEQPATAERP